MMNEVAKNVERKVTHRWYYLNKYFHTISQSIYNQVITYS